MISEKLFELAFEYKKTRLWNVLWDTSIFAVKLFDGKIGYISIMGAAGEHCGVGLYIGDSGFNSLRSIIDMDEFELSPFQYKEKLLSQECLQCAFEEKEELTEEEREEAKEYARAHGIKISGKNAYPQFSKYKPYRIPWALQTEQDQEYLCDALAAAIALAKELKNENPQMMLDRIDETTETVPLVEYQDGKYIFGETPLPAPQNVIHPAPVASNDIAMAKLKKMEKHGVWQCEVILFPKPIQSEEEEIPYYPTILLAIDEMTDFILPVPPVVNYEENPEELLDLLTGVLLKQKIRPLQILVPDERSYAFFQSLCSKLGIKLSIKSNLETLRYAEMEFWERFTTIEKEEKESISSMLDALLSLTDEQLQCMPEDMVEEIKELSMQESIPKKEKDKLKLILQRIAGETSANLIFMQEREEKREPGKKNTANFKSKVASIVLNQSYVVSVSLFTGCYRHIQISGNHTLFELHEAILDAFGFEDDDHAHAFFMDNKMWSNQDSYFLAGADTGGRCSSDYNLNQVGLFQGKQFKYVFDFGDEWKFQCKILRIVDGDTKAPMVIKSKGKAPRQYTDWEEDEEDDED